MSRWARQLRLSPRRAGALTFCVVAVVALVRGATSAPELLVERVSRLTVGDGDILTVSTRVIGVERLPRMRIEPLDSELEPLGISEHRDVTPSSPVQWVVRRRRSDVRPDFRVRFGDDDDESWLVVLDGRARDAPP